MFFPIKVVLFGVTLHVYEYKQHRPRSSDPPNGSLFSAYKYLKLDIFLVLIKFVVSITLVRLEPQF